MSSKQKPTIPELQKQLKLSEENLRKSEVRERDLMSDNQRMQTFLDRKARVINSYHRKMSQLETQNLNLIEITSFIGGSLRLQNQEHHIEEIQSYSAEAQN